MIVQDRLTEVTSSGTFDDFNFGLSQEGLAVVLDILRNQLYSNKEAAVVRELSSNAYDAMAEAGKADQPFIVGLPTDLEPTFRVRDFGFGLTPREVREVFVEYGSSTKRGSNDYIGQKGIGAKCPFAYGDSFMVISYQKGRKCTYTAYLDPSMIGKMALLGEEETAEPDGLEVIVSVREDDISKFITEAQTLFKYWKVRPIFQGVEPTFPIETVAFEAKNHDWLIPNKAEAAYRYAQPVAIMGGVAYTLNADDLDWTGQDQTLRTLLHVGIRLWMNIGDLEVSASREALQYTTLTQEAIFDKLISARNELTESVNAQLSGCKTMYEAKVLFSKVFDLSSPLYALRELFKESITFNGAIVTSEHWTTNGDERSGAVVKRFKKGSGRRVRAFGEVVSRINATELQPIIINDLGTDRALLSRLAVLVERDQNALGRKFESVQLISVKDATLWAEWVKEKVFDAPLIKLSSLPQLKLKDIYPSTASSDGGSTYHSKYAASVLEWSDEEVDSYDAKSYWEASDIDYDLEQDAVYVEIHQFQYKDKSGHFNRPTGLSSLVQSLENAGIEVPKIIGIKSRRLAVGRPAFMLSLEKYIKRTVNAKMRDLQLDQHMLDFNTLQSFEMDHNERNMKRFEELQDNGPITAFVQARQAMKHTHVSAQLTALRGLASGYGDLTPKEGLNPTHDLVALWRAIFKAYPLFSAFDVGGFYNWDVNKAHVQQYIDLIKGSVSKDKNAALSLEESPAIAA